MQKLGFSIFCVLSLDFENCLLLGLIKHYRNRVSAEFCVFVVEREKNRLQKMITGISGFGFCLSKNGCFVTHICFQKMLC